YANVIKLLIYAIFNIYLNIIFAVSFYNRYIIKPIIIYIGVIKRIFKYFRGIIGLEFIYIGNIKSLSNFTNIN
ncbi:hypothetical protein B0T20DRAFT_350776, partial [Sordaria brevicollis]